MDHSKAAELFEKYHRGETSAEENALLETWYLEEAEGLLPVDEHIDYEGKEREMWLKIKPVKKAPERNLRLWSRIVIAAAAVTAITLSVWLYTSNTGSMKSVEIDVAGENDAAPGKNTATLTLANGKAIQLSDAKTGVIVSNELKYSDGTVLERGDAQLAENLGEEDKINTLAISTPRGGTYQVILPDGTRVWLNAESVLKFPSSFSGTGNRTVELTGEAYFEVFKNERQPFVVLSGGQHVKVLGTHFNINAYQNELGIETTLLEGSVEVTVTGETGTTTIPVRLRAGQQSVLNSALLKVNTVNADEVVAWKNGQFIFNEESLTGIMRQLERWYNVKVDYSTVPDTRYYGAISRNVKLSKVLQMLELTGNLKLKIENEVIKVYK